MYFQHEKKGLKISVDILMSQKDLWFCLGKSLALGFMLMGSLVALWLPGHQ